MLGLTAIFVVIGASAAVDFQSLANDISLINDPPYYESYTAFTQARLYLQQNVPVEDGNFNSVIVQRHRVAGLLVAVTDALVVAFKYSSSKNPYDPLKVVDQALPRAWSDYNTLAARPLNKLLSEASAKIRPVADFIDSLCIAKTVEDCNQVVGKKVRDGSAYLRRRGELLLLLGQVSDLVLNRIDDIEYLLNEALRLLSDIGSAEFTSFVKELSIVKDQIRASNPPGVN